MVSAVTIGPLSPSLPLQAQTQLREVTEARDQLATQLQQHTTTMEELKGKIGGEGGGRRGRGRGGVPFPFSE